MYGRLSASQGLGKTAKLWVGKRAFIPAQQERILDSECALAIGSPSQRMGDAQPTAGARKLRPQLVFAEFVQLVVSMRNTWSLAYRVNLQGKSSDCQGSVAEVLLFWCGTPLADSQQPAQILSRVGPKPKARHWLKSGLAGFGFGKRNEAIAGSTQIGCFAERQFLGVGDQYLS